MCELVPDWVFWIAGYFVAVAFIIKAKLNTAIDEFDDSY
jgi:hypothetical protein